VDISWHTREYDITTWQDMGLSSIRYANIQWLRWAFLKSSTSPFVGQPKTGGRMNHIPETNNNGVIPNNKKSAKSL
jgi:hypothetical protein